VKKHSRSSSNSHSKLNRDNNNRVKKHSRSSSNSSNRTSSSDANGGKGIGPS